MLQEIKDNIRFDRLKNNWGFLLSGLCFSVFLFLLHAPWNILSVIALFAALIFSVSIDNIVSLFTKSVTTTKILSIALTVFLSVACVVLTIPSGEDDELPKRPDLFASALVLLSTLFFVLLFCVLLSEITALATDSIRFKAKATIVRNLRSNILLFLSAMVYFRLNLIPFAFWPVELLFSSAVILAVFTQFHDIFGKVKSVPLYIKIYAAISSLGICHYSALTFRDYATDFPVSGWILGIIKNKAVVSYVFSYVLALMAYFSVFVFTSLLLNLIIQKLQPVFHSLSKIEITVYLVIAVLIIAFVCCIYMRTRLFYEAHDTCDLVYVFDTPDLMDPNAYLCLFHHQNDIKQPLFAVFAAPIVGFWYFLSLPLSYFGPVWQPVLMNVIQIFLLIMTNVLIAKMLKTDSLGRICFVLVSSVTYSTLLFSLVMEQYIIAGFWLILAIYSLVENNKQTEVVSSAAGGTLLTGLALMIVPGYTDDACGKTSIRSYLVSVEKRIVCFVILLLALGRIDIILNFSVAAILLSKFTDGPGIIGRFNQFSNFVSSYYIAPDASASQFFGHLSWQLNERMISTPSILGIVIFALCFLSFIINRKNKFAVIAALWAVMSFVLLCIIGWGSAENAMIIYSLYFGWAYTVLLFMLFTRLSKKIRFKLLVPIFCLVMTVVLVIFNFGGIKDLIDFAIAAFPI